MPNQATDRRGHQLGVAIRYQREQAGLTQTQLARVMGHDQSFVSRAEKGQRGVSIDELYEFADALGCTVRTLLVGIT